MWTLMAAFIGAIVAMMGMVLRVIRTEIGGVNVKIDGLRGELKAEISGLRGEMDAKFARVDTKLDHLDRDVQALVKHVFPERD